MSIEETIAEIYRLSHLGKDYEDFEQLATQEIEVLFEAKDEKTKAINNK